MNPIKIFTFIGLLTASTVDLALAQTAPVPPNDGTDATADPGRQQSAIVLNPFVVQTEKDTGYIANDSLSSGQINTKLINNPTDVAFLTREFLDDIGAYNYADAAQWLTSAAVTPPNTSGQYFDFGNLVSFRGMPAGGTSPLALDYFPRYQNNVDAYIIDRIEAPRGANSVLYGFGSVGGVLNVITKRALIGRDLDQAQLKFDSEGSRRASADINRSIGDKVAIRMNLLADQERSWIQTFYNNRYGGDIAGTYRPWKGAELRVEGEVGQIKTNTNPGPITDKASSWTGSYFVTAPITTAPSTAGVLVRTTDRLTFAPADAGDGVINLKGFAESNGTGISIPKDGLPYPNPIHVAPNFSLQPDNTEVDGNYNVEQFHFEQQIGTQLVIEAAGFTSSTTAEYNTARWNTYSVDVNAVLPNGQPDPHKGQVFSDVNPSFDHKNNQATELHAGAAYTLPFTAFTQRINFLASTHREEFVYTDDSVARSNNPADANLRDSANMLWVRYWYADGPQQFQWPTDGNGYTWGKVRNTGSDQKQYVDSMTLATVGDYFGDRVHLVGGVRRDHYDANETDILTRDATGAPNGYSRSLIDSHATTGQIGTVIFPIAFAGVYANYGETFNPVPSGGPRLTGAALGPSLGNSRSAGLRFNLFGGRLVASLGYYNLLEHGHVSSQSTTPINNIWNDLNLSQNDIGGTSYRDTITYAAHGYELDLVANLTSNLRLILNGGVPRTKQTDTLPDTRAYYAANIAQWQAGANNTALSTASDIQTNINTLNTNLINSNNERELNGTMAYTANSLVVYTVPSGWFRSLRAGIGANLTGRTIIGNQVNLPYEYFYQGSWITWNGLLGYTIKTKHGTLDLQCNLSNIFNYNKPIATNTTTYKNVTVPYSFFYYKEPVKASVTSTFHF